MRLKHFLGNSRRVTAPIGSQPAAPTLTSISPTTGTASGGTTVTLTGTNFVAGAGVTFGGVAATSVVVVSPTSITCVDPSGSNDTSVDVVVTTSGGSATLSAIFHYLSEPTYDGAIHTMSWSEDFESYANVAALRSAYAHDESHGTLVLDTTNFHSGSQAMGCQFNNDGCLGSVDANVDIEKSWGSTLTATHRDWYSVYWFRFPTGFLHYWSAGCGRGVGHKEWVLWRPNAFSSNASVNGGKFTFSAVTQNWNDVNNQEPLFFPSASGLLWWCTIQPTTAAEGWATNTKPPVTKKMSLIQHLATTTKDPASVSDGNWHRMTIQCTMESTLDAGDGRFLVWIDGVQIMNFDGQDPTNFAYNQTYTRDRNVNRATTMGIFNAGAPQGETRQFDDIQNFYRTAS